jgi:type II secretory pathway pseudopilin PulG
MKIYAIAITVIAILVGVAGGYLFWQLNEVKAELSQVQEQERLVSDELLKSQSQLQQAQNLIDTGFTGAKENSDILKNSLETFLIAGDLKIFTISETEAQAITDKIQGLSDKMDKVGLEKAWSDFLKSQTLTDYFAFARNAASNINGKLENIH